MKRVAFVIAVVLLAVVAAAAQSVTSSVHGSVADQTGAVVIGAECTLTGTHMGRVFTATSWTDGGFNFPSVPPGTYALKVGHQGMKTLTMNDIVVTANEVRSVGRIVLQVGGVQETVTVTAEVQSLQLNSAERSGTINGTQLNEIAMRGRDFMGYLGTIPGVVDLSGGGKETTDTSVIGTTYILGNNASMKNPTLDGVTNMDTGGNNGLHVEPNMDAIAEVKVLTSSYQAEYGRNAAAINVVTKGGTREFHGSAYDYYRHESLNANNLFNNRAGRNADGTLKSPKSPYRYRISGYSFGGPVYIPGKFNQQREKLFFFFSQELTGMQASAGTYQSWMPTDLERNGNFSQSRDVNGSLVTIKDPLTGQAFPGNIIPQNRLNQYGKAILAILPSPNYTDSTPGNLYRYNYRVSSSAPYPKRQEIVRTDYNVSPSLRIYYRLANCNDEQTLPYSSNGNFPFVDTRTVRPGQTHVWSATKTFSPTLVNELTIGLSGNRILRNAMDKTAIARSRMANIPQWFSDKPGMEMDPSFVPDVTFGGIPANPANMSKAVIPYDNMNRMLSFTDSVGKVMGKYQFKLGLFVEDLWKGEVLPSQGAYYGSFSFSRNTSNPFDTGHSYANALAGIFNSYTEFNDRQRSNTRMWTWEWYMQDNWRVTNKLTLEVGLRMMHWTYGGDKTIKSYAFLLSQYDRNRMAVMYVPAIDTSGKRAAQDPVSKAFAPAALIGLFVPGSGDPFAGIVQGGTHGLAKEINSLTTLGWAPRFGFAYDLFGKGKTAIRGGFGVFKDRNSTNPVLAGAQTPPNFYSVTAYYGNLDTFANTAGALGPTSPTVFPGATYKPMSVMNFNLGIQQYLAGTVVDTSYVGGLSRHVMGDAKDVNAIPMYSRFDPANRDATTGSALPDNFLRPYRGYAALNLGGRGGFMSSTNYNSLQVSANRRFRKGLQYGVAFTFSKALGVNSFNPYFPTRTWDYGPLDWDRSKVFKANYIYQLPKLGTKFGPQPAKWLLDDWVVSGMITFMSGAPFTPGFSTVDGQDITGSAIGARITVTGDPKLPKSEKAFSRNFNTDVFQRTPQRSFGNAGNGLLRRPGLNNWDTSLTKRIPLKSERRYLQFRWETFNTFNHTQFTSLNSTARFDATGKQIDTTFGQFTAAANPRIMQLSLRLIF